MRLQRKSKVMKIFYKNIFKIPQSKKGFTLIELLVVVILVSIVGTMASQLINYIYKDYKKVEMRWEIQQEVQYIMSMFTGNTETLLTTTECAIFDDPNGDMLPKENTQMDVKYSYFWAKPINMDSYKANPNNYNEGFEIFYRGRGTTENIKLNSESTKVGIKFNISTTLNPLLVDKENGTVTLDSNKDNPQKYVTGNYGEKTEYVTDENGVSQTKIVLDPTGDPANSYSKSTIDITVYSSSKYANYSLTSSFHLANMVLRNNIINHQETKLVGEYKDNVTYEGVMKTSAFTQCDENGNPTDDKAKEKSLDSKISLAGYTDTEANKKEDIESKIHKDINISYNKYGSVIRFISIQSFMQSDRIHKLESDILSQGSNCFLTNSIKGSIFEKPVLNNLRNFRDNVLSNSSFGKLIISDYYNIISPFFNKKMEKHPLFYKNLGKTVAYPAAAVSKLLCR